MKYLSTGEIDRLKCKLYDEFYKEYHKLLREDGVEYWRKARQHVEPKIREYIETGRISEIEF